jgi:gas vesicle protein
MMMKMAVSFLFGVVTGAVVALLYAPSSGEELRGQIQTTAQADMQRMREEWNRNLAQMQAQINKLNADATAYMEQMRGSEGEGATAVNDK